MPSWNIHLAVGERLNKKLKFTGKKKEEFLLGCILPDINNGYINRVKEVKRHGETHYAFDQKSSLNFYAKYREKIERKEPIYLGYLVHLYTDGYFNYDFYRKVKNSEYRELSHEKQRDVKHNDFWKYDLKFKDLELKISDEEGILKLANEIEGVKIDQAELREIEEILANDEYGKIMEDKPYLFYNEKALDEVMDGMVESFTKDYLNEQGEKANA